MGKNHILIVSVHIIHKLLMGNLLTIISLLFTARRNICIRRKQTYHMNAFGVLNIMPDVPFPTGDDTNRHILTQLVRIHYIVVRDRQEIIALRAVITNLLIRRTSTICAGGMGMDISLQPDTGIREK